MGTNVIEKREAKVRKDKRGYRKEVITIAEKVSWRFVDPVRSLTNSRVIYNSTFQDSLIFKAPLPPC